jgi:CubicO group peptidase (beta-lactamase class C family)
MPAAVSPRIEGDCRPRFAGVRAALEANFAERGEIGSAVSVYHEGRPVVDLWGGTMDRARQRPWRADTLCIMYSIAKSVSALSLHMLADEGGIDLEAPVAKYWPEFAQNGKAHIRVRDVVSHCDGVWGSDAAEPGDVYHWDRMIRAIEQQEPAWPVGAKGAYDTVNIGFKAGEIVRRVTGQRVQDFVQDRICRPLGAAYYLGVPDDKFDLCAHLHPNPADMGRAAAPDPAAPFVRARRSFPVPFDTGEQSSVRFRKSGIPSFAGFGEARGMARIYAALCEGGALDGVRIISKPALVRAVAQQWSDMSDGMLGRPMAMGLGFMRNPPDGTPVFGPWPDAFGHSGSGGARVLAVPSRRLAVCFVSNLQSEKLGTGARTEAIVQAACAAVA